MNKKDKVDVYTTKSDRVGFIGLLETFLRTFRTLSFIILLIPVIALGCFIIGLAFTPSVLLFNFLYELSINMPLVMRALILGMGIASGYLVYGVSIIFTVPFFNFIFPFKVRPWRGPWQSIQTIPWYIHNALTQIVRYTFLDLVTPTPLNVLFYKMMGMKVGKGCIINTTNISDPCLITLEDKVTIGGSVTIFAHYGQKGYLIIEPVTIKKGANIGLKCSIMGNVVVGENVNVPPHAVLLPKTRIPDNGKFEDAVII